MGGSKLKIAWKRKNGRIDLFTGMFLLVFLMLLLFYQIQLMLFYTSGIFMEDALAASNLASAVIDVEEYGKTHIIRIASPEYSYQLYQESLKRNLCLDETWESSNKDLISGQVEILQYMVYNVKGQDITVYSYENGNLCTWTEYGKLGSVHTPDGTLVESTSVYSRIGFPVKGILGVSVYAQKEKSVDIVANDLPHSGESGQE